MVTNMTHSLTTVGPEYGPDLRVIRTGFGVDAPRLARAAHVNLAELTSFESGQRTLNATTWRRLYRALVALAAPTGGEK